MTQWSKQWVSPGVAQKRAHRERRAQKGNQESPQGAHSGSTGSHNVHILPNFFAFQAREMKFGEQISESFLFIGSNFSQNFGGTWSSQILRGTRSFQIPCGTRSFQILCGTQSIGEKWSLQFFWKFMYPGLRKLARNEVYDFFEKLWNVIIQVCAYKLIRSQTY